MYTFYGLLLQRFREPKTQFDIFTGITMENFQKNYGCDIRLPRVISAQPVGGNKCENKTYPKNLQ